MYSSILMDILSTVPKKLHMVAKCSKFMTVSLWQNNNWQSVVGLMLRIKRDGCFRHRFDGSKSLFLFQNIAHSWWFWQKRRISTMMTSYGFSARSDWPRLSRFWVVGGIEVARQLRRHRGPAPIRGVLHAGLGRRRTRTSADFWGVSVSFAMLFLALDWNSGVRRELDRLARRRSNVVSSWKCM